ncbi:MAG: DUF1841 family protein [Bacteroidetes bacterium]|jgi:Holliday junction resolvasome RuvABC DNA-binding subunit|nr:DUF1841 family protein [Bacteroidota bacterium]
MEPNEIMREQLFETIDNQVRDNNPPEVKAAFKRLKKMGFEKMEIKEMLAYCLSFEIYNVMALEKEFDEERYIKNIEGLPEEPSE